MKSLVRFILKVSARRFLARRNIKVIAVTGSVGKSTAKEMIASALSDHFKVRKSPGGFNNEYGLPLSVLNLAPGNNIKTWIKLIFKALIKGFLQLRKKTDPDILVLEMGADHPGDITYLASIAKPDIAIITNITPVHLDNYSNISELTKEKLSLISHLKRNGTAIINTDDDNLKKHLSIKKNINLITIGKNEDSAFRASNIQETPDGLKFTVTTPNHKAPIRLHLLGEHHIYPALISIAVGTILDLHPEEIKSFESFIPPPGRMSVFKGIHKSTIIDSSYNSSPLALEASLQLLGKFKDKKKILVLGDMRELGYLAENSHIQQAKPIIHLKPEMIILVGPQMKQYLYPELIRQQFSDKKIHTFMSSRQAGQFLKKNLPNDSIILIKGSQNTIFLEETVSMLLKNKDDQNKLCRQDKKWQKAKDIFFHSLK